MVFHLFKRYINIAPTYSIHKHIRTLQLKERPEEQEYDKGLFAILLLQSIFVFSCYSLCLIYNLFGLNPLHTYKWVKKKKIIQTYTFTYENTNKQTKTHILYGWTKANTHKCYDKHDLACTLQPSHFAPMFTSESLLTILHICDI